MQISPERIEKLEADVAELREQLAEVNATIRIQVGRILENERYLARVNLSHILFWTLSNLMASMPKTDPEGSLTSRFMQCYQGIRELASRYDERIGYSNQPLQDVEQWRRECHTVSSDLGIPFAILI